eukprot:12279039-Heterocapsa_arctica.AAC.1
MEEADQKTVDLKAAELMRVETTVSFRSTSSGKGAPESARIWCDSEQLLPFHTCCAVFTRCAVALLTQFE